MASPNDLYGRKAERARGAKASAAEDAKVVSADRRHKAARWTAVLGAVVVLCTAWALMVPAISITGDRATNEAGFFAASSSDLAPAEGDADGGAVGDNAAEAEAAPDADNGADAGTDAYAAAQVMQDGTLTFEQQIATSAGSGLTVRAEAAEGVLAEEATLDELIASFSTKRAFSRIARVNVILLRIAMYELRHRPETPVNVVISEAVALSQIYATQEDTAFINGVLATYIKTLPPRGTDPTEEA